MKLKSFNPLFYIPFETQVVEAELPAERMVSEEGRTVLFIFSPKGKKLNLDQTQLEVADFRICEATKEERQVLQRYELHLPDAPPEDA